ncbi:MAG: hypothetical protein QHH26_13045 [Armatimonadota bacterium]|nr:hypothetical protein [Armatimonadota bacterium]
MVRTFRVVVFALVLLIAAGTAFAYRLICIPTAETLPDGMYRLEIAAPLNESAPATAPTHDKWLPCYKFDGTVFKGFEISVISGATPSDNLNPLSWRANNTQVSLSWTVARETEDMPGYGMGVLNWYDSEDHVNHEESAFAGIYKTVPIGLKYPATLHLLAGTKALNGVFGGFLLPLSKTFVVAAEYSPSALMTPGNTDENFVWALGYNHNAHWRFKYANIGGDHALGIVYTGKWLQK